MNTLTLTNEELIMVWSAMMSYKVGLRNMAHDETDRREKASIMADAARHETLEGKLAEMVRESQKVQS